MVKPDVKPKEAQKAKETEKQHCNPEEEENINQKCRFCGAETIGSDVCHKCLDSPERQAFFQKAKKYEAPKTYPNYAAFCDYEKEGRDGTTIYTGFKPARVAIWLKENEHFKTDKKTGMLYYGDEETGTWTQEGETYLRQIVAAILGDEGRECHYRNIRHHLVSITYQNIVFSNKIACANGLIDLENKELKPISLDEMPFYRINVKYDPTAKCPNWEEFIKQVLNPEDVSTLQEWSGYLLLPDYRFHKLMWLHGGGRNGKGVWQRTMESILGEQNVSSVGLEEFDGNHRFAMRQLYGKLFNPCSEPTTNRILQTALLKKATGQDTISAECKGKDKRINFPNCAKITVIANKFPRVNDTTTAFRERRMFITFPNEFTGKDCIVNLEKVWLENPDERSGILNWMLEGLHRLLSQSCFTESKTQVQTEIKFERASDTVSAFISEMCIMDKNRVTTRSEAYEAYKEYCDVLGLDSENEKKFTQRLKDTPRVSVTTVSKPKRERAWKGFSLKQLKDDGTITSVTDVTLQGVLYPQTKSSQALKNRRVLSPVTSVTRKVCVQCANFRMPSCESEGWETRNGNALPLTNWCFKQRNYKEAS
jgi:P4 family phage/plasmid primase-like protien